MTINVFVLIYFVKRKGYDNSIFKGKHREQHLENQKEEIEKFAARKNLTVNRWVTEVVKRKSMTGN